MSQAAQRYAEAFFELAQEEGKVKAWSDKQCSRTEKFFWCCKNHK